MPSFPRSGQFVMQNPAQRINSGSLHCTFQPDVLPSPVLEAASFSSSGLLGTTLFHEQFNELFLQPSHASEGSTRAWLTTSNQWECWTPGPVGGGAGGGGAPCQGLLSLGYSPGWYPHPGNYFPGISEIVIKATTPLPSSIPTPHCQARLGKETQTSSCSCFMESLSDAKENSAFQGAVKLGDIYAYCSAHAQQIQTSI